MKTITIEDPVEAAAEFKAARPDLYMHSIWFGEDHRFIASAWSRDHLGNLKTSFQDYGSTAAEAVAAVIKKIDAADPLKELEAQAAARGLKLVPA